MKMVQSSVMILVLLTALAVLSFLISKKSLLNKSKSSPFECGFSNFSSARTSVSIHFFMIAIIFLMFDIEIALMLPMFITIKMINLKNWFIMSWLITIIITYGLYHEWMNGVIEWAK